MLIRKLSLFVLFLFPVHLVYTQTILEQGGKYGLSDANGTVILQTKYDLAEPAYFVETIRVRDSIQLRKKFADIPLYFIKHDGKYAYAYKFNIDSTKKLEEEQVHWIVSDFEFDSLALKTIGSSYYDLGFGYTTLIYKKAGLWGMIYIQTHTVSGEGIFPSAGFYADGLGRQYRLEAKYDQILSWERDNFFTTYSNGKYGFLDPVLREEYSPEFDTVPTFISDRKRSVRKNGKWGAVKLEGKNVPLQYMAPCKCNELDWLNDNFYMCAGVGDTIAFFDASVRGSEYVPLDSNQPITIKSSQEIFMGRYGSFDEPITKVLIAIASDKNKRSRVYDEVYLYDLATRSMVSYHDSSYTYKLITQPLENGLIARFKRGSVSRTTHYEFYKFETREFRFALDLDSNYDFYEEEYTPKNLKPAVPYIHRFYSQDKYLNERTIGYYDYRREKFTRRKPKYKR